MKLISHLFFSFLANLLAIWLADYLIHGFEVEPTIWGLATVASLLTIVNVFLRPILKFILTPLIILTFGLFTLILNAALLWALDFYLESLTISGIIPLVYATLLISVINFILHLFHRH